MSIHAKLSPEALQRLQKQRRTSTISSIVVSILSVVLIALILGIFLLPNITKETPVIVTYASSLDEEEKVEKKKVTTKVMRKPSSPSSSMAKVIAASIQSPTSIPVPEVIVSTPSLDFGDGDDFGSGWSDEPRGSSGGVFGVQVTSGNLGVILDISGSAHAHLDKAIAEIDKNFPLAHMVLVVGCGMSDITNTIKGGGGVVPGEPRVVTYGNLNSEKEYNSLARSAPAQLELFFKKIGAKQSKELRRYFKKRENLYLLYGGDVKATNFAFDHVLERKVDTIYWFADFADGIDAKITGDLTKKMKRDGVTVIAHNFLGKPVGKLVEEMTKETGGRTIALVPGQE